MSDQTRPWYKKKRFLIPLGGIMGLFTLIAVSSGAPSPTAVESTQTATAVEQNVQTPEAITTPLEVTTPIVKEEVTAPQSSTNQNTTTDLSNNNYYENVDGNQIHSPAYAPSVPAGASAQCGDGTYSFSQHRSGTCSHHGGVAIWY